MPGYRLKYLFRAFHANGDVLAQGPEDCSVLHHGKSAYADVDHEQLVAFGLEGDGKRYGLDMLTGVFTLNGHPIIDPERTFDRVRTPLRLIYFRRVSQHLEQLLGTPETAQNCHVAYHFGWQANDEDGNNVQRVLEVE